jgi:hypothetical protein
MSAVNHRPSAIGRQPKPRLPVTNAGEILPLSRYAGEGLGVRVRGWGEGLTDA